MTGRHGRRPHTTLGDGLPPSQCNAALAAGPALRRAPRASTAIGKET